MPETKASEREVSQRRERESEIADQRRDRGSLPPAFLCSAMIASGAEK